MSFIHFMSLKFIKITQKMLNILEFIRCSYKKSVYKKFQIYPSFTLFLEISRNHPKMFAIFEFIR